MHEKYTLYFYNKIIVIKNILFLCVCIVNLIIPIKLFAYDGHVYGKMYTMSDYSFSVLIPNQTNYINDRINQWTEFRQKVDKTNIFENNGVEWFATKEYLISVFKNPKRKLNLDADGVYYWRYLKSIPFELNSSLKIISKKKLSINHHSAMQWIIFDYSTYATKGILSQPLKAPFVYIHTVIDFYPYLVVASYYSSLNKSITDVTKQIPFDEYNQFVNSLRFGKNYFNQPITTRNSYLNRSYQLKEKMFLTQTKDIRPWGNNHYIIESEPLSLDFMKKKIYFKDFKQYANSWYGSIIFDQKRIVSILDRSTKLHIIGIEKSLEYVRITVQIDNGPYKGIKAVFKDYSLLIPRYLIHN